MKCKTSKISSITGKKTHPGPCNTAGEIVQKTCQLDLTGFGNLSSDKSSVSI
jgi:hypothetical protein